MAVLEARDHPGIFTSHAYPEQIVDLGEIRMNYATTGRENLPALVLVPGQSQSWWSYEEAMPLLAESFRVYAVDLRGPTVSGPGSPVMTGRPMAVSGLPGYASL